MEPEQHDSGLRCPWCSYNLTALVSDRCPECGRRFVIAKPHDAPLVGSFTLAPSMACPECGYRNAHFMPRRYGACDHPFTLFQRIFGTGLKPPPP